MLDAPKSLEQQRPASVGAGRSCLLSCWSEVRISRAHLAEVGMRPWPVVLAVPLLASGCYVRSGLGRLAPTPGTTVRVNLRPEYAAGLTDLLGAGVSGLDGRVFSITRDTMLLDASCAYAGARGAHSSAPARRAKRDWGLIADSLPPGCEETGTRPKTTRAGTRQVAPGTQHIATRYRRRHIRMAPQSS
jgi:hypothetical protein